MLVIKVESGNTFFKYFQNQVMKGFIITLINAITCTIGVIIFVLLSPISFFKRKMFNPDKVERILVFSWGGLGNFIMLLPFLNALKIGFKEAEIHIVTMSKVQYDFMNTLMPDINVIFMQLKDNHIISGIRFLARVLRGKKIDLSFHPYLEHTGRSIWWSRFIGTQFIVGFASPTVAPWQTVRLCLNKEISEGENYLNMLRVLKIPIPINGKLINVKGDIKNKAKAKLGKHLITSNMFIGIHCGSAVSCKEKRWDVIKFMKLIKMLITAYNDLGIVVFFGPDESDLFETFSNEFNGEGCVNLIKTDDFLLLCGVMEHLRLFVSNDSGLMHLASAVGIPVISIWGPTDPVKNSSWGKQQVMIRLGISCSPCYKIGQPITCTNRVCLDGITTEKVFNVIAEKL